MADMDCQSCLEYLSRTLSYEGQSKKEWLGNNDVKIYVCPECGHKTMSLRTWIKMHTPPGK